jgi:nucleotide-binding universal stress UspA family protein
MIPVQEVVAMKRILVGVDGSEQAKAAVAEAARLAEATGSELELACVLPELTEPALDGGARANSPETERAQRAHIFLHELGEEMHAETSLLQGNPADRLAQEAQRPEVWLVVVGHRGRGAVQRRLLGSVADRLAQISPKPLLVVR